MTTLVAGTDENVLYFKKELIKENHFFACCYKFRKGKSCFTGLFPKKIAATIFSLKIELREKIQGFFMVRF